MEYSTLLLIHRQNVLALMYKDPIFPTQRVSTHVKVKVRWGPAIRTTDIEVVSLIRTLKVRISESLRIVNQ